MMFNLRKRKSGFSLIELLVSITILLVLVGIAAFFLEDYLYKSKVSKASQDLDMFQSALNMYDALEVSPFKNYNYANGLGNLNGLYSWSTGAVASYSASWATFGGASAAWTDYSTNSLNTLVGSYLKTVPKDPWGQPYILNTAAGYIASTADDLITSFPGNTFGITEVGRSKDIVKYYLGEPFIMTKATINDINGDGSLQLGEYMDVTFNKDVQSHNGGATPPVASLTASEFQLANDEVGGGAQLLSAATATATTLRIEIGPKVRNNGRTLRCVFAPGPTASLTGMPGPTLAGKFLRPATVGLFNGISRSLIKDMDQYCQPHVNSTGLGAADTFGRPVTSLNNPYRQVTFSF